MGDKAEDLGDSGASGVSGGSNIRSNLLVLVLVQAPSPYKLNCRSWV